MIRFLLAYISLSTLLIAVSTVRGQAEKTTTPPKTAVAKELISSSGAKGSKDAIVPGTVDISFLNTSTVRLVIQSEKLEIATEFGKLSVPVKSVRAIEFGLRFPEGIEGRIHAAVKNLASKDYRERERACDALVELGPHSFPAVLEASRGKELESAGRAKEVLKKLRAKHAKADLKTSLNDKVMTTSFTILGRITTPSIKAKTPYFGEVELHLADMRTLRALAIAGDELGISVDAAKYAIAGKWMETDFHVDGQGTLVIAAKGVVDTWPQQPGQYLCGPGGVQGAGGAVVVNGMILQGGGVVRRVGGQANGQALGGALIGKIGDDGEPFVIGERFEGAVEKEGKLYLQIGPSPWNCNSTGSYDVTITRKKD